MLIGQLAEQRLNDLDQVVVSGISGPMVDFCLRLRARRQLEHGVKPAFAGLDHRLNGKISGVRKVEIKLEVNIRNLVDD